MNSKLLLGVSIAADLLDFAVIGQIPGLGHLLDLPVFILHFWAGGPKALFVLAELIPVVGVLPIFSFFAWKYHSTGHYGG